MDSPLVPMEGGGTAHRVALYTNRVHIVIPPGRDTLRLKAACICALSGMSVYAFTIIARAMDRRELELLNNILQLKSMMSLHSRCIIFINNLYINKHFEYSISHKVIPSVMTLLMYNVTNHIKLIKKRIQDNLARNQPLQRESSDENRKQIQSPTSTETSNTASNSNPPSTPSSPSPESAEDTESLSSSNHTASVSISVVGSPQTSGTEASAESNSAPTPSQSAASAPVTHDQVDKMYNDALYVDFIASACILLGNLTTNFDNCMVAESYSVIDIMTLLFHNSNDHNTPEVLANVVKCLANLATIPSNHSKLLKSNILAMAIRLLLASRLRIDLRAHLVLLLANMVGAEGALAHLVDRAVVQALASFLSDITHPDPPESVMNGINFDTFGYFTENDTRFQRFGCLMVANLATDSASIPLLFETSIPKIMISLCYSDFADLQRQAVRALYSFSTHENGLYCFVLESSGAVEALQHVVNTELVRLVVNPGPTSPDDVSTPRPSRTPPDQFASAAAKLHYEQQPQLSAVELLAMGALAHIKTSTRGGAQGADASTFAPVNGTESSHAGRSTSSASPGAESGTAVPSMVQLQVDQERARGNDFFNNKRWNEAVACYSRAIELSPNNVTLYSNRSAAFNQLGQYHNALLDAEKCITLQRDWVKGHFRRGKALLGLQNYTEAIVSLKEALNCDSRSTEIQDALRTAVAKAKEDDAAHHVPDFCHLNASAIIQLLNQVFPPQGVPVRVPITLVNPQGRSPGKKVEIGVEHLAPLLVQLLDLLKMWYDSSSTTTLQQRLMGDTEPDEVGLELHNWATRVNMNYVMQAKGIDFVLFHMDMCAPAAKQLAKQHPNDEFRWYTNQDLSCYHFGYFITTALTRLVVEGHNHFAIGALKRIIQLNSDRVVRVSVGSPLSQAAIITTGIGGYGHPKRPWLRPLFLAHSGIRCIAMDSFEGLTYEASCLEFLKDITANEWLGMPQDQLDSVMEWTVLPIFKACEPSPHLFTVIEIWANIFAIPGTRQNMPYYHDRFESEFTAFVISQLPNARLAANNVEIGAPPAASNEASAYAVLCAYTWLSPLNRSVAELLRTRSMDSLHRPTSTIVQPTS